METKLQGQGELRMPGKLYGIGIGPGDPELMTIKAVRILSTCNYLAVPGENPKNTLAYGIVEKLDKKVGIGLAGKKVLGLSMPMTKNEKKLEESHALAEKTIRDLLDQGQDIAFLTLGDPTIYSTYMYVHERIAAKGYEVEIINGISSFLSAAAKAGLHLGSKNEQIHIIPASYDIEEALELSGTKIFMKAGRAYVHLKKALQHKYGFPASLEDWEKTSNPEVVMVENCSMEAEAIYRGLEELPETAGYYTIVFVKDGK